MKKYSVTLVIFLLLTGFIIACRPSTTLTTSNDYSQLLGVWKTEKQYSWNYDTNQWEPGIIFANGSKTDNVFPPIYTEIKAGGNDCPSSQRYVLLIPGGCFKVNATTLEGPYVSGISGISGELKMDWSITPEGKLETILIVKSDPIVVTAENGYNLAFWRGGYSQSKAVASRTTLVEAHSEDSSK